MLPPGDKLNATHYFWPSLDIFTNGYDIDLRHKNHRCATVQHIRGTSKRTINNEPCGCMPLPRNEAEPSGMLCTCAGTCPQGLTWLARVTKPHQTKPLRIRTNAGTSKDSNRPASFMKLSTFKVTACLFCKYFGSLNNALA